MSEKNIQRLEQKLSAAAGRQHEISWKMITGYVTD
jgi:hypothetical protein